MISKILDKLKLNYEDLSAEEKKTYQNWVQVIAGKQITIDNVKDFLKAQITAVTKQLQSYENHEKKDLFLKAQLRNLEMLYEFITAPERSKEWLQKTLKDNFNI